MNKVLLTSTLALTLFGGAWALYAKAPQANGYMMVISRFSGTSFSSKGSIITISPDGQTQTQEMDTKTGSVNRIVGSLDQLSVSELKTVNDLRAAGWRVRNVTPVILGGGSITETVYLLEKE